MFRDDLNTPVDVKHIPEGFCGHADVRDIARLHVNSLLESKYDNGRWAILEGIEDNQAAIDVIHKYRPKESAVIVVGTPNSLKREALYKVNVERTAAAIDFELIPFEKSVIDMYDAVRFLKQEEEAANSSA